MPEDGNTQVLEGAELIGQKLTQSGYVKLSLVYAHLAARSDLGPVGTELLTALAYMATATNPTRSTYKALRTLMHISKTWQKSLETSADIVIAHLEVWRWGHPTHKIDVRPNKRGGNTYKVIYPPEIG